MTRDVLHERLIITDRTCGRQKARTGRMLQCVLATWPGAKDMGSNKHTQRWKERAVEEYRERHKEPKRNGREGISPALLFLLAELVIRFLIELWQRRELDTRTLTTLHLQA